MNTDPQLITTMVKMISILIILVGGLLAVSWFAKKKLNVPGGISSGKKIKIIENCHLGVKKTISLVQVPGKILVLGITGENLSLLTELNEDAVLSTQTQSETNPSQSSFTKQLKRFSQNLKKES